MTALILAALLGQAYAQTTSSAVYTWDWVCL